MLAQQLFVSAAVLGLVVTALWVVSLWLRDVSIVDVFWGPLFLMVTVVGWLLGPQHVRALILLGIVGAWSLRLAGHLGWRAVGKGEDRRYQAMRRSVGRTFALRSLLTVFWLQACLALLIALPLHSAMLSRSSLTTLDALGFLLAAFGLAYESIADLQLARFKADPNNHKAVMQRGLWRHSRHPNYFGDFCFWWGIGLVGLAAGPWWVVAGPVVMTVLLLRVSGVTLLERTIVARRPEYREYLARTNAFFPGPQR
ncbi:MAG: DUF1295 domain-containing protein [Deltaproteobacteria bacterium]|nr:DUF1295 domain-containing protein [Deltaproteobacteria bacterium]